MDISDRFNFVVRCRRALSTHFESFKPFDRPVDCLLQSTAVDWFEQVVDRIYLESADRVFIIGGHKGNKWQ